MFYVLRLPHASGLETRLSSYAFLSQLLVEEFGVDPSEVTPDATPVLLGLDSLSTVEMIHELEDKFRVKITDEQANFETLGEAAAIVDELIAAKGP